MNSTKVLVNLGVQGDYELTKNYPTHFNSKFAYLLIKEKTKFNDLLELKKFIIELLD